MQTTLLGLAIAFIIALLAALIGPYFIDWNQFRPQFEAEAGRIIGVPVRVAGELDARLLPAPTLRLRSVTFGGNNDLGRLRADKLDVEFSLSALMRGEWRATELTVNGMAVDLGLDARGRVDLPSTASGTFNLASLAIERLNLTGRIALHDAASRSTLELSDIAFSGDVRSLAGSVRGDGRFTASGTRYPFRISSGPSADGSATRLHLNIDPGERAILADLEGVLAFDNRLPKFDGALTLAVPAAKKAGEAGPTPWKLTAKLKADPAGAKFDQIDASFGAEDNALKVGGVGDLRFGASPLLRAVLSARQIDADKLAGKDDAEPLRILPALRAGLAAIPQAGALLALLGLDRVVAAGEGASQFEGRLSGAWRRPLQLNAKLSGGGLDADAQGSVELSAPEPKASVNLRVRNVNLAPLFGTGPAGKSAQTVSLSSRLSLSGNRLTFDDLDGSAAGSHLRGRLAVTLDQEKSIDGEVGLDTLDLAPALALAVGAAGRDAGEPLSAGLLGGWRGRIAFQALRGTLPGGVELRPIGGTIRSDGQSLALDALKGGVGGGELSASFDARNGASGVALNARIELSNVDATTLRYRDLALPKGRASVQMALTSQGRSVAALTGALAGNGTVTLDSAEISGLNPRAFEIAIRASDGGQVADDNRLRQLVEPALAAGPIAVASAQIPFTIRDGRLRVGATPLEAKNARAIVSGGYDIPADQADIRASLTPIMTGLSGAPPEIQLFAAGPPDKLNRTVDLAPLSSWLAVRTIDRETRRLDAIERGEPPPATAALPTLVSPDAAPEQVPANVPLPGQDPRRAPPRPKAAPTPKAPLAAPAAPSPPLASQQVAPLPPPIEVRPAPGPAPAKPKPKPPLVLTPSNP
ncbi:AsmA-like C-terminal region-containing protein [Bradyrhizobium diazoefficiens]|uniref:AsmA family protein n=1 Tax=Bradyrhizobium diazoefficiens TaxID=1355477 RepID=UPI00309A4583